MAVSRERVVLDTFRVNTLDESVLANLSKYLEDGDSELMRSWDHILVKGEFRRKPCVSLNSIPGFSHIKKNLKEDLLVETGNVLQLHAASYILGGRNCCLVGSANSKAGKSLAYMIPIISKLIVDYESYSKLEGGGPIVLVLCSTNSSGVTLQESFKSLTENSPLRFEFVQDKEEYQQYLEREKEWKKDMGFLSTWCRSPDIVLASAECAAAIIKDEHCMFSFDRLSFLVFDDAHLLLKYRKNEVKTILAGFKEYVNKKQARKCLHQTIFCSNSWTPDLELCYQHTIDMPILIISSPIQAIKYSGLNIKVVDADDDSRFNVLKDVLSKYSNMRRVLVMMKDWVDVRDLQRRSSKERMSFYCLEGEGVVGAHMQTAMQAWKSAQKKQVVVCTTDINLREMRVTNADLLIHYDIPEDNLTSFAVRFSSMWKGVENPTTGESTTLCCEKPLSVVILDRNLPEANIILWKLHSLGAEITADMLESATQERLNRIKSITICRGFVCMADCVKLDPSECRFRHCFVDTDFTQDSVLPKTGQVELYITETIAPNLYKAKILRYCDRDSVTNKVSRVLDLSKEALSRHLKLKNLVDTTDFVRNGPKTFSPGTMVVITLRDKQEFRFMYTRGIIDKIVTRTFANLPSSVRIECIDLGETKIVRVDDIFALPDEMANLPPLSVQVVLANTAPPLGEKTFRLVHTSKTKEYFQLYPVLQANISLSIGNTIWVKRLVKLKKTAFGKLVETWDAAYELCRKRILDRNPDHLERLYQECEKNGFSCQIYRELKTTWVDDTAFQEQFCQVTEKYSWAHLPICNISRSGIVSETVAARYIGRDHQVFVNVMKFQTNLETLEKELNEKIIALKNERDFNAERNFYRFYNVGLLVAAYDEEETTYRRGLITRIEQRDGKEDMEYNFTVFLVDLGIHLEVSQSSVFPIPKLFAARLPFQAIRLTLGHVLPACTSSHTDHLFNNMVDFLMPNHDPIDVEVVALSKFRIDGDDLRLNSYEAYVFGETQELGEFCVNKKSALYTDNSECQMKIVKDKLLEKFRAKLTSLGLQEDLEEPDYPKKRAEDDFDVDFENEMDEDEWDVNVGDGWKLVEELFPSYCRKVENYKLPETTPGSPTQLEASPENHSHQKAPNSMPIPQSKTGIQKPLIPEHAPSPSEVLKKAPVTWFQNDSIVFLRVHIPDVSKFECKVQGRCELQFLTLEPPDYGFVIKLFKKVEPEIVSVKAFGQYCEIKLKKRKSALKWNALTLTKGLRWIRPELCWEDVEEPSNSKIFSYQPIDFENMPDEDSDSDKTVDDIEELS